MVDGSVSQTPFLVHFNIFLTKTREKIKALTFHSIIKVTLILHQPHVSWVNLRDEAKGKTTLTPFLMQYNDLKKLTI